jgi:hypothetical protein
VESNGAGVTLASQRWLDHYWRPVNTFGYRDHDVSDVAGKKVVWVVGDSHAAGWGIEDVRDRFADRLAADLGEGWRVITLAKPGWDTRRQIEAALAFPIRPHVIIHTYCLNDAERAAAEAGVRFPQAPTEPASVWARFAVRHSHLTNLAYWRWRSGDAPGNSSQYWDFIQACFVGASWQAHSADLARLLAIYHGHTETVIAMVIPNLLDVEASRPLTAQVERWFEEHGATCIDLSGMLADRAPGELVVNRFDPHASKFVHALIAEKLYSVVKSAADGKANHEMHARSSSSP